MAPDVRTLYEWLKVTCPALSADFLSYSARNRFGSRGGPALFDTPHGYWAERELPSNHSQRFLEKIVDAMGSATDAIDIAGLADISDWFRGTFISGLIQAASKKALRRQQGSSEGPLTARIICGFQPAPPTDHSLANFVRDFVTEVHRSLELHGRAVGLPGLTKLVDLYVIRQHGMMTSINETLVPLPYSWNHAKIVASDNLRLLTGGHNWWGKDYLKTDPIFDLCVYLEGEIASQAHRFCDAIWRACAGQFIIAMVNGEPREVREAPSLFRRVAYDDPDLRTPVLAVAQPGALPNRKVPARENPSREAMYLAMERAERSIDLSQQDILSNGGYKQIMGRGEYREWEEYRTKGDLEVIVVGKEWPRWHGDKRLLATLAKNLLDGVRVRIVLTNRGAKSQLGWTYSSDAPPAAVARGIAYFLLKDERVGRKDAFRILSEKLDLRTIGFGIGFRDNPDKPYDKTRWPDGTRIGNHAKFWAVDERLFYVGSANTYPEVTGWKPPDTPLSPVHFTGDLTEWGVIVGGEQEAATILGATPDGYFGNLFNHAQKVKIELGDLP